MKKTIKIIFLLIVFLIEASFLAFNNTVYAQNRTNQIIRVSPSILNISLSPGKTYKYEVLVENLTSSPLPLRAGLENFTTTDEEGGFVFENPAKNPMNSWINISEKDMIIPAKSEKNINIEIKIPSKVPFGGYYMILFLEPLLSEKQTEGALISAKVGVLMLANIGTSSIEKKANILTFNMNEINEKGSIPFLLRVQNNGLNHFSAKPFIHLKNIFGSEKSIEIEEKFIFPGKVRRWEGDLNFKNVSWGIYNAKLSISTGEGNQIQEEKIIVLFPISKAVLIGFTVIIVIMFFKKRRRINKAIKILITNS